MELKQWDGAIAAFREGIGMDPNHLHSVALRLEPARRPLLSLNRSFQSRAGDGSIQLSIFTYRPTASIEFLLDVEDMAIFADVCTSLRVSVVGDPDRITGQ